MLKFFHNGIKDSTGKLHTCFFSTGQLISFPAGTITIYKKECARFPVEIREAFTVENDTDSMTDYFEEDRIRVTPNHPLYVQVKEAAAKAEARRQKKLAA